MTVDEARAVVAKHSGALGEQLRLHDWHIEVAYTRLPEGTLGRCRVNSPYCRASIEIDNEQVDDGDEMLFTLRHEFAHIFCWPMHAYGEHVEAMTAGKSNDSAWTFWLERMVWSVERLMDNKEEGES